MEDAWNRWRDALARELGTLAESEFINTSGPAITRERKPGLFGRRRTPEVISAPVVCFLGMGDHVLIESVALVPTRGESPLTDEQCRQLGEAGWLMPGDPGYEPVSEPNLGMYIPSAEPERAAELARRTYRILGVDDPASVEVDRGS